MKVKSLKSMGLSALLFCAILSASISNNANAEDLIISNVNLVSMANGSKIIKNAEITIKNGRIYSVKKLAAKKVCKINCIDGSGKWLIPGLTDAHVHLENDYMLQLYMNLPEKPVGAVSASDMGLPYIANGVTQVFDLSAMKETFEQKDAFEKGLAIGPHIISAYMIDGEKPILPIGMSHAAANPEQGRQQVRSAYKEGYDIIKIYSLVDLETYLAIIDEANKHKMKVVGHIPGRGKGEISKYFVKGFNAVAHAEEYAQQTSQPDEAKIPEYVKLAKRNNTALITTLTLDDNILEETSNPDSLKKREDLEYLNPLLQIIVQDHNPYVSQTNPERIEWLGKIVKFNNKLVKEFKDANVPILAGTDAPVPGVASGFALPDELIALNKAGLTPYQALYSATKAPCDWLGANMQCGTIENGKRADMIMLEANPIENIENIRKISAVIINGKVYNKTELDLKMASLKSRFKEFLKK